MNKIQVIENSLRCFRYSLWSFVIPWLGIPLAVWALVLHNRIMAATGEGWDWNPAHRYLWWAFFLSCLRLVVALLILVVGFVIYLVSSDS